MSSVNAGVTLLVVVLALIILIWATLKVSRAVTHKLIFKPEPGPHDYETPVFPNDVEHEDLRFPSSDGESLHGWLVKREGNKGLILICHGNRGSIAGREDTALFYLAFGMDVCLFDYRGYGKSSGTPSEAGTYADVDAVWDYLTRKRGYAPEETVLLGRSLGAAIASHLAAHVTPKAVILESTFSTLPNLASELYPLLKRLFTVHVNYNTLEKIARISAPLLLVHSTTDELIGLHHAKALLEAAPSGTRLIEIKGRHRDGFVTSKETYIPAVTQFISQSAG
ncbi:MAG: alpha/beta hydrolase [Gammaproteobacteria bacterium]